MTDKNKSIFKEFWYQIIMCVLSLFAGVLLLLDSYVFDSNFYQDYSIYDYRFSLPKAVDVSRKLAAYSETQKPSLEDINHVKDVINEIVKEKQDVRFFLRKEEGKLSEADLAICYSQFANIDERYDKGCKYPNSAIDSLSCVLMYPYIFKK